jgi:hypothetical protein
MKNFFLFFLITYFLFQNKILFAQYNPDTLPNTFRSKDNPLYWKNRPPFPGYWQQDVYYKINAYIDEMTDIISAKETLTYWNNSHDTLRFVYFHLYQNISLPGGYMESLNENNNVKPKYGKYESNGLGCKIDSISADGKKLKTEVDYTIMKVYLQRPLAPNDSIQFFTTFKTYWDMGGNNRKRNKKFVEQGFTQYDGAHWYPEICVYDRKFGWDTEQHLGHEFYGDFGTYDVYLNFASNFIVEATGVLQNEKEMLPDSLRKKLDIKNFVNKPWESKPSIIIPYKHDERKIWHFYSENVHDFAFTADPTYRIGETDFYPNGKPGNKVRVIALAEESHAGGWQDASFFTAKVIETYSNDFGKIDWPKVVIADARDGTEYNMLTLDGGRTPTYAQVLAHEVGHQWFYGQVANNETYRAALDEGFTQFIDSWALQKLLGEYVIQLPSENKYEDHFTKPVRTIDEEVFFDYLNAAIRGKDEPLNTSSDMFNGALGHGGGYNTVYYKTATMLYNLQYVLGDSLFQHAMQNYFQQWKFCHPYDEDFRNSIIQFTLVDLNWFFDEWLTTIKVIDYKIGKVKSIAADSSSITFKRKGRMQMPIDFQVISNENKKYNFYIPNDWFQKQTDATTLPKWYGWDNVQPAYTCKLKIPGGIKNVIIDTSYRLADINILNNSKKFPATISFDSQIKNDPDWHHYEFLWRPDLWYNAIDGFKAGIHLEGNYMNFKHIFSLTILGNTQLGQTLFYKYPFEARQLFPLSRVNAIFSYQNTFLSRYIKNTTVFLKAKWLDGLFGAEAGIKTSFDDNNIFSISYKTMIRPDKSDIFYLVYPDFWNAGKWNNTLNFSYEHKYVYYTGTGQINVAFRSSVLGSDYFYSNINLTAINSTRVGKFDLRTRTFLQYGTGNPAPESLLSLAGANNETLMENRFTRAGGFIPTDWTNGINSIQFQMSGGLNLRGFSNLEIIENYKGENYLISSGNTGAAENVELNYNRLFKIIPSFTKTWLKVNSYIFLDVGTMTFQTVENHLHFSNALSDAGPGFAFTIKHIWVLDKIPPLTIRTDFPIISNPIGNEGAFDFRCVIGLNRTF